MSTLKTSLPRACAFSILMAIGMSILPTSASARFCSLVPTDTALKEAPLVIRGQVVSLSPRRTGAIEDSSSIIRVDRVLKGHSESSSVEVTYFLCGGEFYDFYYPGRPVIAFVDTAKGSLLNETAVLPASKSVSTTTYSTPKDALRAEMLSALDEPEPTVRKFAVTALAELDAKDSMPTLRKHKSDPDFAVRFRILSWLAEFGDAGSFEDLVAVVSTRPFLEAPPAQWPFNEEQALALAAYGDFGRFIDSFDYSQNPFASLPLSDRKRYTAGMMRLAQLENPKISHNAIHALKNIADRDSFSLLASVLDDPSRRVRYDAMSTLCLAMDAEDLPCPDVAHFMQDEQRYIERCRRWWEVEQSRKH